MNISRQRRAGNTIWLVLGFLVLLAVVGGVLLFFAFTQDASDSEPILRKVSRENFIHDVLEEGEVESSDYADVKCMVKSRNSGGTDILWVIEERSPVKKDEVLVKLDSSGLEQELDQQEINCNTSRAIKVQAENVYVAAVIAKKEYLEGTFVQAEQTILSEIFVAEDNLRRAELSVRSTERLAAKGLLTALQLEADRFAVKKAENELNLAQQKLKVLRELTKQKELKALESDIETAKAKWEAEEQSYQLELKKRDDIKKQITNCKIVAPKDGIVVYANKYSSRGSAEFVVEEGAKVREGQTIIRIPESNQTQVKAKINETQITLIKAGMPVTVELDALGGKKLQGEVIKVNSGPEPSNFFSQNIKQYATFIRILDTDPEIRPGLTASVRIHVQQLSDAMVVPIQAVVEHGSKTYCLVKTESGYDTRPVAIGASNKEKVVIQSGLEESDEIVMSPRVHKSLLHLPKLEEASVDQVASRSRGGQQTSADGRATDGGPRSDRNARRSDGGNRRGDTQAFFNRLDTDQNGKLSSKEMASLPEQFRQRFDSADTNGDGALDKSEIAAAMQKMRQARGGDAGGGAQ